MRPLALIFLHCIEKRCEFDTITIRNDLIKRKTHLQSCMNSILLLKLNYFSNSCAPSIKSKTKSYNTYNSWRLCSASSVLLCKVCKSSVLIWPFSETEVRDLFGGLLRLSSLEFLHLVLDFIVVSSYLRAWWPGWVGPFMFTKQGISKWNAFLKLSERKAYKMGLMQLKI